MNALGRVAGGDRRDAPADGPRLAVAMFSLTDELMAATRTVDELLADLLDVPIDAGLPRRVELDGAQHFRGHPHAGAEEIAATRSVFERAGGAPTLLGGYAERWAPPGVERSPERELDQLIGQLRTAAALGAEGLRAPAGTIPEQTLAALVPELDRLDLILALELQGATHPDDDYVRADLDAIARLGSERIRLVFDMSLCTPRLPVSWLAALDRAGVDPRFGERVAAVWGAPATELKQEVGAAMAAHPTPPELFPLVTACLSRFASGSVADWADVLPLVTGVHLKFWDADDADGRVTTPIRELADALAPLDFDGFWTTEWGGHQWQPRSVGWRQETEALLALVEPILTPTGPRRAGADGAQPWA